MRLPESFYIQRLSGFLDGLTFVLPAVRTHMMRLLHFVTVRALRQRWTRQMVVRAARTGPPLGMSSFWIRHCSTPRLRPIRGYTRRRSELGRILWALRPEIYLLFLEPVLLQPCEGSHTRVRSVSLAPALFMVQIGTARGAQSPAIALADHFHRQRQ